MLVIKSILGKFINHIHQALSLCIVEMSRSKSLSPGHE